MVWYKANTLIPLGMVMFNTGERIESGGSRLDRDVQTIHIVVKSQEYFMHPRTLHPIPSVGRLDGWTVW